MTARGDGETFAVIGAGEVGLRLARALTDHGFDVRGIDIDEERVRQLEAGSSYIRDIEDGEIQYMLRQGFVPTTEYEHVSEARFVAVCVPTPLQKSGQPDISYAADAIERMADVVPPECTIIIESTVYPGATQNLLADILADAGWTVGEDIFLGFSPERVDPGNEEYGLTEIPKVIGGVTPACGDRIQAVYEHVFEETVRVETSTEAEMVKILENTFRNVNIALVNELAKVSNDLDIDFWDVIDAAETKPFGFMPFYPGPGLGGHCIPVDPMYLSWRAKQSGLKTPLINLADKTNREMPDYVVRRLVRLLNEHGIALPGANIHVLGVAYKSDVGDVRNTPAIDIIEALEGRGATVTYSDPYVREIETDGGSYSAVEPTPKVLGSKDCVLLVTHHSAFHVEKILDAAELVFDTRNATDGVKRPTVERL